MRWFKKKAAPFDDNFSIIIERPPDYAGVQELRFEVPYDYYAQLLSVSLTILTPLLTGMTANWLILQVLRGGDLLYQCAAEDSLIGGSKTMRHCFGLGVGDIGATTKFLFPIHPLPLGAFLYPFDLLRVFVPSTGDTYYLSDLTIVMKQWKTS